jgi:hypothetical protein
MVGQQGPVRSRVHASVSTFRRICSIVKLRLADGEQGRELDDGGPRGPAVEAGVVQCLGEEPAQQSLRLVVVSGLLGHLVLHQLDAEEVAGSANISDDRQVPSSFSRVERNAGG